MLADIDRKHVLVWITLRLNDGLWVKKISRKRIAAEQHLAIRAAQEATNGDPDLMIEKLAHALARARVAIHNEETRKAWLEAGR